MQTRYCWTNISTSHPLIGRLKMSCYLTYQSRKPDCSVPAWQARHWRFSLIIWNFLGAKLEPKWFHSRKNSTRTLHSPSLWKSYKERFSVPSICWREWVNESPRTKLFADWDNGVFYNSLQPFRQLFPKQLQPLQPGSHMTLWADMDRQGNYAGFFHFSRTHTFRSSLIPTTSGGDRGTRAPLPFVSAVSRPVSANIIIYGIITTTN